MVIPMIIIYKMINMENKNEFLCKNCDNEPSLDNCKGCRFRDTVWIFRYIRIKLLNIGDRLLHRNCLTCKIPKDNFCKYLHIAMLNGLASSNKLTKDKVCDQYKRK